MPELDDYILLVPMASLLLGLGAFAWDALRHRFTRRQLRDALAGAEQTARIDNWRARYADGAGRRLRTSDLWGVGAALTLTSPAIVAAGVLLDLPWLAAITLLLLPLPATAWWLELRDRGITDAFLAPVAAWMASHIAWIAAYAAHAVATSDSGAISPSTIAAAWQATIPDASWHFAAVVLAVIVATAIVATAIVTPRRALGTWRALAVVLAAALVGSVVWSGETHGTALAWSVVCLVCIACSRATRRDQHLAALRAELAPPGAPVQAPETSPKQPAEPMRIRDRDEVRSLAFPAVVGILTPALIWMSAFGGIFWAILAAALATLAVAAPFAWASSRPTNAPASVFAATAFLILLWSLALTLILLTLLTAQSSALQVSSDVPWATVGGAAYLAATTIAACLVLAVLARKGIASRWGGLLLPIAMTLLIVAIPGIGFSSPDSTATPFALFGAFVLATVAMCAWALLGPARTRQKPEESAVREMRFSRRHERRDAYVGPPGAMLTDGYQARGQA